MISFHVHNDKTFPALYEDSYLLQAVFCLPPEKKRKEKKQSAATCKTLSVKVLCTCTLFSLSACHVHIIYWTNNNKKWQSVIMFMNQKKTCLQNKTIVLSCDIYNHDWCNVNDDYFSGIFTNIFGTKVGLKLGTNYNLVLLFYYYHHVITTITNISINSSMLLCLSTPHK